MAIKMFECWFFLLTLRKCYTYLQGESHLRSQSPYLVSVREYNLLK